MAEVVSNTNHSAASRRRQCRFWRPIARMAGDSVRRGPFRSFNPPVSDLLWPYRDRSSQRFPFPAVGTESPRLFSTRFLDANRMATSLENAVAVRPAHVIVHYIAS